MNKIEEMAIRLFRTVSYQFKVIAFVKIDNGTPQGQFYTYILSPRRDLTSFVDRIIEPIHKSADHKISAESIRYITFHEKRKGDKTFSMKNNPVYLISWSPKRGFFSKLTDIVTKRM